MIGIKSKGFLIKKILIFIIILIVLSASVVYLASTKIKKIINTKIINQISLKSKRNITFSHISYSTNKIVLNDFCISEKKMSKKNFGCAKLVKIKFDIIPLIYKSDIVFDYIDIEDGNINFIKSNDWNFSDILKLFPDDKRALYQRINIKEIRIKNFDLLLKYGNTELLLKNLDLELNHSIKSSDFDITLKSDVYSSINDVMLFACVDVHSNIKIIDRILEISLNNTRISNLNYQKYSFEEADINLYINRLKRKFDMDLRIKNLDGFKSSSGYKKIADIYKKIYSNDLAVKDTIDLNLKAEFNESLFKDEIYNNDFKISSVIDLKTNNHRFEFRAGRLYIKSNSDISKPEVRSNFGETVNDLSEDLIVMLEKSYKMLLAKLK
jgi:predicted HNH restriction endonuclease